MHMIVIMSEQLLNSLLERAVQRRRLPRGVRLFHQGDPVHALFIVAAGQVALYRHLEDGSELILHRASSQTVIAEASVYSPHYHCSAVAEEDCQIAEISKPAFLSLLDGDRYIATAWAAHLARTLQSTRQQCEILRRKTVAERLDGWLDLHGGTLPPKGQWKSLAAEIGVSPEALYREIAKRH